MRIWWCQEHETSGDSSKYCYEELWLNEKLDPSCRMVPMRLIPDNAETLNQRIADVLDAWAPDLNDYAVEKFTDDILAALDGETP